jgi:hypothetical protein
MPDDLLSPEEGAEEEEHLAADAGVEKEDVERSDDDYRGEEHFGLTPPD